MKIEEIPSWKLPAALGYGIVVLTFVVIGGWSATAMIDSAVIATGVVAIESNRKTVQHLEGGIIREILVRDGDQVQEGQVLFRLDTTQTGAGFEVVRNQLDVNVAIESRLRAELNRADAITFPEELLKRADRPYVARAIADQKLQFEERRSSIAGQIGILETRIVQYQTEIEGLSQERSATHNQLKYINEELVDLRHLLDRNLVPKSRVMSLERERSRLEGIVGRSTADIAKAENGIADAKLQIGQVRQKFIEEATAAITEVRQKLGELREKIQVADDALRRADILAPRSGMVQNLKFFTVGGVVRAGEPLLDVVPEGEKMLVLAQVSPFDVERIAPGLKAEVRFSAFHSATLPIIIGRVDTVSRDRLIDEATRQPYFSARVIVEKEDIPTYVAERMTAGMPADVIIPTGERTVLNYLVRPLQDRMRKALRER